MTTKTSFIDSLALNQVQRDAVVYDDGPELVFAGAGTGKTRVLTAKIAWLIREKKIFPGNILAATFTNKAAREMRERVELFTGLPCEGLWIGTFHSMCCRILRREAHHLGFTSSFTIYDTDDSLSLVKSILKERTIDEKTLQPRAVLHNISGWKNACKQFADVDGTGRSFAENEIISIFGAYQAALKRNNAMDFDDLIGNTVFLFRDFPAVLEEYRTRFKYTLIDEYQDTNVAQFMLVRMLSAHGRVFVVGDDDQSIYAWRGAKVENILSFAEQFSGTRVFKLEQNYRSSSSILDLANAVIKHNTVRADKKLWTAADGGREVVASLHRDDRHEAEKVVEKIQRFIREDKSSAGDIAILYRTNAQSRVFEDALRKRNVPYILVGGLSFYERKEVKDCLAYLRLIVNPKDDVSCERILNVPARGIGDRSQEKLYAYAREHDFSMAECIMAGGWETSVSGPAKKGLAELAGILKNVTSLERAGTEPREVMVTLLTETGYITGLENENTEEARNRIENINELVNALESYHEDNEEGTLAGFLEQVTLTADIDNWEQKGEAVNLITLHSAKGLEFSHVFLTGVEDGILPSRQNFDDTERLEEERRLLYVGITRARKTLDLSWARERMRFGQWTMMGPSRFIDDVPDGGYRYVDETLIYELRDDLPGNRSAPTSGFAQRRAAPGWQHQAVTRTAAPPAVKRPGYGKIEAEPTHKLPVQNSYDDFNQSADIMFKMGMRVHHTLYGPGQVMNVSGFGTDTRLVVNFEDGSRKKMIAKFANLEVL